MASLNQVNNFLEKWGLSSVYFTTNPIKFDDKHWGYKYFICNIATHNIIAYGKTYVEVLESLQEYIDDNYVINVWYSGHWTSKHLEYFHNIDDIHLIKEAREHPTFLKVYYQDDTVKCYENIHGSWAKCNY